MKTEIKKMVLTVEGKDIELTIQQAKKLNELLGELFDKEVIREEHHHHHTTYPWHWNYPTVTYYGGGTGNPGITFDTGTICCSI